MSQQKKYSISMCSDAHIKATILFSNKNQDPKKTINNLATRIITTDH